MRRFPPLLRLRQMLGSHYHETLHSSLNPSFLRQPYPSSPMEIHPSLHSSPSRCFINPFPAFSRTLSSSSGSANIVHVGSDEGFNTALKKAEDEKLPSIFYFTAAWCGPCKILIYFGIVVV
ncbi:hypothetical protein KSP39_PZI003152 [Platanthera zijinensis]|uniref:Thioredoxin domain-containing protein n=1 Tax=Platanthera zijinensis TaxID=2320716 RepID=A0AAP0BXX5_9ASPA